MSDSMWRRPAGLLLSVLLSIPLGFFAFTTAHGSIDRFISTIIVGGLVLFLVGAVLVWCWGEWLVTYECIRQNPPPVKRRPRRSEDKPPMDLDAVEQ